MNQYSNLLYTLKELAEDNSLVHTVTQGNPDLIDLDKANIFPLVHINIESAEFTNGQTIIFTVSIECLTNRDLNKDIITDKFWNQDNEVDNHNETLAILNDIWTRIYRDWNNDNISTDENVTLEKIEFERGNILDGWSMSFNVEVSNTTQSLC